MRQLKTKVENLLKTYIKRQSKLLELKDKQDIDSLRASQKNMKPLISKSLLVPILYTFLLLIFSFHLHTPTQAARMLLPFPGSHVASMSLPLPLSLSSSSSYQVDLLHHLPPAARKLGETSSSTSTSLRRIPRSGPNPTQNR